MAKVVILSGSPRAGGNTDDCASYVARELTAAGHGVDTVRLADCRIEPCRGCRACTKLGHCAVSGDDFERVWGAVAKADFVVMAAPVYWLGPPGVTKNFIDRTHGYYAAGRPLRGLKAALLSVAADDGCWEPHERVASSWLECYGAEMLPPLRIRAREKGQAMGSPEALKRLDGWVADLLKSLPK